MTNSTPQRVIAIGDVHGCVRALHAMVEILGLRSDDTLVMLGDCVDRGPESCQVIEELFKLRDQCQLVTLLGNHEEMMLNFLDGKPQPDDWLEVGGATTVESYRDSDGKMRPIPESHVEFIRSWGDYYETPSHFFAHGCYQPDRALSRQHWQTMRWQSLKYGIPEAHISGKTAIVGHTSQKSGEILNVGYLICIDTFCWGGGWLTALDTVSGEIWQVDRDGHQRSPKDTVQSAKPL
jgi:serine/threonine protein phosphatase 1